MFWDLVSKVSFPNYKTFDNSDTAHNDFINRFDCVVIVLDNQCQKQHKRVV